MKHDIFEFNMTTMTPAERFFRVLFLLAVIGVLALDVFVWRP